MVPAAAKPAHAHLPDVGAVLAFLEGFWADVFGAGAAAGFLRLSNTGKEAIVYLTALAAATTADRLTVPAVFSACLLRR
jgi:hypothetical protein